MKIIKINGFIDDSDNISKYVKNIDYFIGGISSEERFDRGLFIINISGIKIKEKIIFYFNEVLQTSGKSEEDFDKDFQISKKDIKIKVDLYDVVKEISLLEDHIKDIDFRDKKILIDFSVMIKPHFFLLLKYLVSRHLNELYLLYTEPSGYEEFTRGTILAEEIPGFSGTRDMTKKDALIILLGFEGDRAFEILNETSPNLTIPINGFPAYRPEYKDKSIVENKSLLEEEDIFKNLRFAPANDPFETKNTIKKIYLEFYNDYNLSIAPIGTKPMALGSCLFALEHEDCRLIYPYPREYMPKSSRGMGKTWLYIVKILSIN